MSTSLNRRSVLSFAVASNPWNLFEYIRVNLTAGTARGSACRGVGGGLSDGDPYPNWPMIESTIDTIDMISAATAIHVARLYFRA